VIVFFVRRWTDTTDSLSLLSFENPQRLHVSAPSFITNMVPQSGQNSITQSFDVSCNKGV
jgi:hypothetical protein